MRLLPGRGLSLVLGAVVAAALSSVPLPSAAQQVDLDRVDALVAEGRTSEARRVLERWWREEGREGTSRLDAQRSLWLRALLTTDAERASLDYQRLVVEYPGGPFSDEALLRLAQAAHAAGDLPTAAQRFRTLLRDYPESAASLEAGRWIDRYGDAASRIAALDGPGRPAGGGAAEDAAGAAAEPARAEPEPALTEPEPAPTEPESARTEPEPDAVESPGRGAEPPDPGVGGGDPPPRSGEPPAAPAGGDEPPEGRATTGPSGPFGVQVGAFATPERAGELERRVERAGFDARTVTTPANRLLRVRVGRLGSREDADRLASRLREAGFDVLVVVDADRESEEGG